MFGLTTNRCEPCLFKPGSGVSSSTEVLTRFARDVMGGEGNVVKHLKGMGYTVSHEQRFIDEFDFRCVGLASVL